MTSYRLRSGARERALRYLRRHATETGPSLECTSCRHKDHTGLRVCREFHCLCGLEKS